MEESLFTCTNCPNCTIHAPREAYYFIPSLNDELIYDPENPEKSLRLIFDKNNKNDYLSHENENYEKFKIYFSENFDNSFKIPEDWTESETRKCIQATKADFKKTINKMKACIEYPIPDLAFSEVKEILYSGFLYMHGLDCNYRPILCCTVKKFVEMIDKYTIDYFIAAINIFSSYLFKHIFIPGQVENWIMFADLSGVSMWKPPTKLLKVFEFLQTKYLCRLANLYIFGMNYILNMCWKIIKKLIDERTAQKFNFISGENDIQEYVLKDINPNQLEKKYGGLAENVSDNIKFPFILPSDEYQVSDENRLISEEEYIEMVNQNKLVTISPYLIQEGKIKKENNVFFNKDGNLVFNDIEFFECNSNICNDEDSVKIEKQNNEFEENKVEKTKLRGRKTFSGEMNNIIEGEGTETNEMNVINVAFENYENDANCCKCSSCDIF